MEKPFRFFSQAEDGIRDVAVTGVQTCALPIWGRWAYLWVFVSVPLVVTPLGWLAEVYPAADRLFAKPILIMLIALPMPVSYLLVKKYYRRVDNQVRKDRAKDLG